MVHGVRTDTVPMPRVNEALLLTATDEPLPAQRPGRPVSIVLDGGAPLDQVRGIEVIRGITFLVRDRTWNTAAADHRDLRIDREGEGFAVTFDARCRTADGDLSWQARITGASRTARSASRRPRRRPPTS